MAEDPRARPAEPVVWHDLECGSYAADLPLWEEVAQDCRGEILDLGCGTGRVALHLARRGHRVRGLDSDPVLVTELDRRARRSDLRVAAVLADARSFELEGVFELIIAPMQLLQLLDRPGRLACLDRVAGHLAPGGRGVSVLLSEEDGDEEPAAAPPLPDVREIDGWIYSSQPLPALAEGPVTMVRRLRQSVSPAGRLTDVEHCERLLDLSPSTLEEEAMAAGLSAAGRRQIGQTDDHVGSTAVILEA